MATKRAKKESRDPKGQTAREVCRERRADCDVLLDHLAGLLKGTAGEEQDWSEAGSLGHLKGLLANAVCFYGGFDTEDIDEVLAEIRGEGGAK